MTNKIRVTTSDSADVKVKEKDRVVYPSMYDEPLMMIHTYGFCWSYSYELV